MHPMLNIAIRAARSAGSIIMRHADQIDSLTISSKNYNDFVSEVDRAAEQEIIAILQKAFPGHGFLAEESSPSPPETEYTWIIDPLDGTTNFLHQFPQFAVSIALKYRNKLEQAVVYDPMRQELFTATRGAGAQLDNHRIRVSKRNTLNGALLGTGFPYTQPQQRHLPAYLNMLSTFIPEAAGIRRAGSAALDLAYVAAGRLDGFWEIGLKPWDIAAGILLIQESGGVVSDFIGGDNSLTSGNIVAGNLEIQPTLLKAIKPHLTPELKC